MKKSILTSAVTATLLTSLSISSAIAALSSLDMNGSVDFWVESSEGKDINLSYKPYTDYDDGTSFTLEFTNAGIYVEDHDPVVCANGKDIIGSLQDADGIFETDNGKIMTKPRLELNATMKKDANITFNEKKCSNKLKLVPVPGLASGASITAKVVNGKSTSGDTINSMTTDPITLGNVKKAISISCSVPLCAVENKVSFNNEITPPGINQALTETKKVSNIGDEPCGASSGTENVTNVSCETKIQIHNEANATDVNVTAIKLNAEFVDATGASVTPTQTIYVDGNSTAYSLGSDTTIVKNISKETGDQNITFKFVTDGTQEITLGQFVGTLKFEDNGTTLNTDFKDINLTKIVTGARTQFTVPYMYGSSGVSNFVKISTLKGGADTELTATIMDNSGHECTVTSYNKIPGNGGSTYIWAANPPSSSEHQALIPSGECSNFTDNQYSVIFTTGSSVNVVSYMRTSRGERYIKAF